LRLPAFAEEQRDELDVIVDAVVVVVEKAMTELGTGT